ncbi:hypothetical protein PS627_04210 [Pseudomonas fluorescens]|uniref:hypothetical protein n=1 Tax=Pseudomonas fluorescens TaxID=294 RepID=UPI0012570400|nr:hypothetical protein [Pseudomonas fluorescens]CAG8870945.1 hypothetical protein PS627_04210 [Pseudomonas fluorescens]VVP79578.1 hypothetical protein PS910_01822 [Pseudomonas fluorescens]
MDTNESQAFFEQLQMPARPLRRLDAYTLADSPIDESSLIPEAGIQGNRLVAFTSGLDKQYKEAVKFSVQIAQSAANAKFDQLQQRLEWYAEYNKVLRHTGWLSSDNKLTEYNNADLEITMESVAFELIKLAAGPNAAVLAELADLAITSLKGDTELTQKLQAASTSGRSGSFDIMPCLQVGDDIVMYDHAMRFEHSRSSGGFWFWSWKVNDVSLQHVANERTLNFTHYLSVEQSIKDKLGSHSNAFFDNLDLG